MRSLTRSPSSTTPRRRSSSSPAASASRSRGSAAARSARVGTASRLRTSRRSVPSSCPSAGEGSEELIGRRFSSSTGVAGWVLVTRQPLVIDELEQDPRFAREAAESTGYVPKGLMAVPLLHAERALGVLEVLDRPQEAAFS